MNTIALRTQLMTEISLMPSDKLTVLAEFIRQLRVPLPTTPTSRQAIMRFAGCWNDMSDNELTEFLAELTARRKNAFLTRRDHATDFS